VLLNVVSARKVRLRTLSVWQSYENSGRYVSADIFCGYPQFSRIRIVISLLERIRMRILCHGYSTDVHYAIMLFCLNLILCIVYIRRHTGHRHKMQLQVIELSNTEYRVIDTSLMFWKDNYLSSFRN